MCLSSKRFFAAVLLVTAVFVLMGEWLCYRVDPIGLWGTPIRAGFNNLKIQQSLFMDIFKPYEYVRFLPDIVYIGTSRTNIGWDASTGPEANAYNFAMSGLSLSSTESYLKFAYKVHKPKKVYLGLDIYSFNYKNYHQLGDNARPSFSLERLEAISDGGIFSRMYAWKDSLAMMKEVLPTMERSRKDPEHPELSVRGWFREHGGAPAVSVESYYGIFNLTNRETKEFTSFHYEPEAMDCLGRILAEAEGNGVEIVLFFHPVSVDEHTMLYLGGQEPLLDEIKRETAQMHPVYDFDCPSAWTMDIQGNYFDFVHYRKPLGDAVRNALYSGEVDGMAHLLTKDNAQESIREEQAAYAAWREENRERVDALRFYFETKEKAEPGAFKEFIGF